MLGHDDDHHVAIALSLALVLVYIAVWMAIGLMDQRRKDKADKARAVLAAQQQTVARAVELEHNLELATLARDAAEQRDQIENTALENANAARDEAQLRRNVNLIALDAELAALGKATTGPLPADQATGLFLALENATAAHSRERADFEERKRFEVLVAAEQQTATAYANAGAINIGTCRNTLAMRQRDVEDAARALKIAQDDVTLKEANLKPYDATLSARESDLDAAKTAYLQAQAAAAPAPAPPAPVPNRQPPLPGRQPPAAAAGAGAAPVPPMLPALANQAVADALARRIRAQGERDSAWTERDNADISGGNRLAVLRKFVIDREGDLRTAKHDAAEAQRALDAAEHANQVGIEVLKAQMDEAAAALQAYRDARRPRGDPAVVLIANVNAAKDAYVTAQANVTLCQVRIHALENIEGMVLRDLQEKTAAAFDALARHNGASADLRARISARNAILINDLGAEDFDLKLTPIPVPPNWPDMPPANWVQAAPMLPPPGVSAQVLLKVANGLQDSADQIDPRRPTARAIRRGQELVNGDAQRRAVSLRAQSLATATVNATAARTALAAANGAAAQAAALRLRRPFPC